MKICSIENCSSKAHSRGWCSKHYMRWLIHGDPNTLLPKGFARKTHCEKDGSLREQEPTTGKWFCRTCRNDSKRAYFHSHKDQYREYRRNQRANSRKILHEAKAKPCADCGVQYPYYVMDFDHRPNEIKKFSLAMTSGRQQVAVGIRRTVTRRRGVGANYFSREVVQEEIAKCDVVCSNCHRERTHQRRIQKLTQEENAN